MPTAAQSRKRNANGSLRQKPGPKPGATRKGRIPETQAEAAAKEARASGRRRPTEGIAVVELPVSNVHANAYNPRITKQAGIPIVDDDLQQLAESIKREGLLQPVEVRADSMQPGHYELIAGERRWRAHKLLKAKTIRCIVVDITDEEAKSHCVEENLRRKDLNPIERARALALLQEIGLTQAAIAKRVGYGNASQVTNDLAMLKLPEAWQQMLRNGDLPATHSRFLAAWRDREPVMQCALNLYRQKREQDGHVSQVQFERLVLSAVAKCSRPVKPGGYVGACPFKPTAAQLAELDVVEAVPSEWGGPAEPRAFNVGLWKTLAKAAEKKAEADAAQAEATHADAAGSADAATTEAKVWPVDWQRHDHLIDWLSAGIIAAAKTLQHDAALKLYVCLAVDPDVGSAVFFKLGESKKRKQVEGDVVRTIFALPSGDLAKRLPAALTDVLTEFGSLHNVAPADLVAIAVTLGVDLSSFRPDARTFATYPESILRWLAAERGIADAATANFGALCEDLARQWPAGEFPPGYDPEEIAKL